MKKPAQRAGMKHLEKAATILISPLKKPSMAFSTVGWPKQVSANLSK